MKTGRRKFIRYSAAAIAATAIAGNKVFASAAANHITGLQLYSVRDDMKADPAGTLKQLAAMNYTYVEHANYIDRKFYGYSAAEFKKLLDDLGLKMKSGHTVLEESDYDANTKKFSDRWLNLLDDAKTVGQEYVISPSMHGDVVKNYDAFKQFMDMFNRCGELCKTKGLTFGYHNHDFEFTSTLNGKMLYDLLMESTDPTLVAQQIDIGNMYGVGGRAADIIKKYPGRFALMHVKDEIKTTGGEMNDGYESTVLGAGVMKVKEIVDLGRTIGGTTQFIIEQESYQQSTPLADAKKDLAVMKKWGY